LKTTLIRLKKISLIDLKNVFVLASKV